MLIFIILTAVSIIFVLLFKNGRKGSSLNSNSDSFFMMNTGSESFPDTDTNHFEGDGAGAGDSWGDSSDSGGGD